MWLLSRINFRIKRCYCGALTVKPKASLTTIPKALWVYIIEQKSNMIILYDHLIPGFVDLMKILNPTARYQSFQHIEDVSQQDATQVGSLFIRSTTKIDSTVLERFPKMQFTATATAGVDHVQQELLAQRGITFADAKGSNAHGVADYIVYALGTLAPTLCLTAQSKAVVVGHGNVGKAVVRHLNCLGLSPYWVDPFLPKDSQTLTLQQDLQPEAWLATTQLLCIHTPMTSRGPWPTQHWLNEQRLSQLPDGAVVICAGRGETLVMKALLKHGERLRLVLDVWPQEPFIEQRLLAVVDLATPHIAGHSTLGKLRGTWQVVNAYAKFEKQPLPVTQQAFFDQQLQGAKAQLVLKSKLSLDQLAQSPGWFDLGAVDKAMRDSAQKQSIDRQIFTQLRHNYRQHPEIIWL